MAGTPALRPTAKRFSPLYMRLDASVFQCCLGRTIPSKRIASANEHA